MRLARVLTSAVAAFLLIGLAAGQLATCPTTPVELAVTSQPQQLFSPGYPDFYQRSQDCIWQLKVDDTSVEHVISIAVVEMSIEGGHNCQQDYLEVFEGLTTSPSQSLHTWCGQGKRVAKSAGTALTLKFHIDDMISGKGFVLTYQKVTTATATCEFGQAGQVEVDRTPVFEEFKGVGIVESCHWQLTAADPADRIVVEMFSHVGEQCDSSLFTISEGDVAEKKMNFSWSGTVETLFSKIFMSSNTATMQYEGTAFTFEECGVILKLYTRDRKYQCKDTDRPVVEIEGAPVFLSLPFAHNSDGDSCSVRLWSPGNSLRVGVVGMTSQEVTCATDVLTATDGSGQEIPKQCVNEEHPVYFYGNKEMIIEPKVKDTVYLRAAGTDGKCNGLVQTRRAVADVLQTESFPGEGKLYRNLANCKVLITSDQEDNVLSLSLKWDAPPEAYNHTGGGSCHGDHISVYDGQDSTSNLLYSTCKSLDAENRHVDTVLKSSTNNMFVEFNADKMSSGNSFQLSYHSVPGDLSFQSRIVHLGPHQRVITSPNYPNNYPLNHTFVYHLLSQAPGKYIVINVVSSDMPARCDDMLEIYKGNVDKGGKFVGRICDKDQQTFNIKDSLATMVFHSNGQTSSKGWKATVYTRREPLLKVVRAKCSTGRVHLVATSTPQTFTSPGYPVHYRRDLQCDWLVTAGNVPKNYIIKVEVTDMNIQKSKNCLDDFLEIFEGSDAVKANSLAKLCGEGSSDIVVVDRPVTVQFRTNKKHTDKGFVISYTLVKLDVADCIKNDIAYVTLTHQPTYELFQAPKDVDRCEWMINSPLDNTGVAMAMVEQLGTNCGQSRFVLHDANQTWPPTTVPFSQIFTKSSRVRLTYNHDTSSPDSCGAILKLNSLQLKEECSDHNMPSLAIKGAPLLMPLPFVRNSTAACPVHLWSENKRLRLEIRGDPENVTCDATLVSVENDYNEAIPKQCVDGKYPVYTHARAINVLPLGDTPMTLRVSEAHTTCDGSKHRLAAYSNAVLKEWIPGKDNDDDGNGDERLTDCLILITANKSDDFVTATLTWDNPPRPTSNETDNQTAVVASCPDNSISIYDGVDDQAPMLISTCKDDPGTNGFLMATSRRSHLLIKINDQNLTGNPFLLAYNSVPQLELCEPMDIEVDRNRQVIRSPNYPYPYSTFNKCLVRVRARPGQNIFLEVLDSHLPTLCDNILEVFEGMVPDSRYRLARICDSDTERLKIEHTDIALLFSSNADDVSLGNGWQVALYARDTDELDGYCSSCNRLPILGVLLVTVCLMAQVLK